LYLEHVNMTVRDVEESIAFYCHLLYGTVSWRGTALNMQKTVPAAHVRLEAGYLSMFEREAGERAPYDYAPPGINHIGFVVDDLPATRRRLADLGVKIEKEADYEPGLRLYCFDPNGIELELVAYPR
jgi:catechol 2,3-dioxygenase-like lactoylglutathione lyase family enzyme